MNASFISIVKSSFAKVLDQSSLRVCDFRLNEVIMVGPGYALLAWLDRDGTSLHYLNLTPSVDCKTVDVAAYLGTKRRWIIGKRPPSFENREARIRFGLDNCASTLMEVGQDILNGEKEWLADPSVMYSPLSELHRDQMSQAIARCVSVDDA